jgi:AraC-like DNA-binding protein
VGERRTIPVRVLTVKTWPEKLYLAWGLKMRRITKHLLLVDLSGEATQLMSSLPEARFTVQPIGWSELGPDGDLIQPSSIVVVEPLNQLAPAMTFEILDSVRRFLKECRLLPVVAISRHPENSADLFASLLAAGLSDWIDLSREGTAAAVERRLDQVAGIAVQRLVNRAVPGLVASRTRHLLGVAAEVAAAGGQMGEFAGELNVAERTASRWCRQADLPPPKRLLAWLRLLLVAEYLDDPRRTLEAIARATGYSSGASVKTALRNMMGTTPRALRSRGAFASAAAGFAAELRELREGGRLRGRSPKQWLN